MYGDNEMKWMDLEYGFKRYRQKEYDKNGVFKH